MKIGITGGRGFIGKHLTDAIKKNGWKAVSFDMPENDLLNPDLAALKKFVLGSDAVIHTAAVNRGTDTEVIAGSVAATYNLISAMEKYKSKAKLIFISSIQAETDSLYGKAKKMTEIMLEDFSKRTGTPVTVFRLTNVFGEGGRPFYNSVVATFCHQVANGKELTVNPSDKKFRFVYVGDIAKIIIKESKEKRKKPFYLKILSSGNELTIPELAKVITGFKNGIKPKSRFQKDLYKTYLSYIGK